MRDHRIKNMTILPHVRVSFGIRFEQKCDNVGLGEFSWKSELISPSFWASRESEIPLKVRELRGVMCSPDMKRWKKWNSQERVGTVVLTDTIWIFLLLQLSKHTSNCAESAFSCPIRGKQREREKGFEIEHLVLSPTSYWIIPLSSLG